MRSLPEETHPRPVAVVLGLVRRGVTCVNVPVGIGRASATCGIINVRKRFLSLATEEAQTSTSLAQSDGLRRGCFLNDTS